MDARPPPPNGNGSGPPPAAAAAAAATAAESPPPPPLDSAPQSGSISSGRSTPSGPVNGRTLATHSSGGDVGSDGMPKLFKIVLTGGPCGGKTTALARLVEFFRTHGTGGGRQGGVVVDVFGHCW